jgi:hypothetical protein
LVALFELMPQRLLVRVQLLLKQMIKLHIPVYPNFFCY